MRNASPADRLPEAAPDLATLFAACRPRSVLLLGPVEAPALPPDCAVTRVSAGPWLAALDAAARFDLVFVSGVLEGLAKEEGLRLLCRLRDFHTARLYVRVTLGEWQENDFFALGMERLAVWREEGMPRALFRFDIATYKPAPEWFNARYWAHPELWDKYPWLSS